MAFYRQLNLERLKEVMNSTLLVSGMVFMILIGAALFSLVFRGFGGEELIHDFFSTLPGGVFRHAAGDADYLFAGLYSRFY